MEWLGLLLIVALLLGAALAAGLRVPATGLARELADRLVCAIGGGDCAEPLDLNLAYGPEIAHLLREHAPGLAYERGMRSLPVDFRECRERGCAEGPGRGEIHASERGQPVVMFTRVIDCRVPEKSVSGCSGDAEGNLYFQYWSYYPDSSTFKNVPLLEAEGYHPHDWESLQVRLDRQGRVSARASSHHGHNHSRSVANWASDTGAAALNKVTEATGIRPRGGWGEASGWLFVSAGSHAGNVRDKAFRVGAHTPAESVRLIPLEAIAGQPGLPDFAPITPPWRKRLWRDPEAVVTN